MRPHSSIMLAGPDRAPSRAMLYPTGFKSGDFNNLPILIDTTSGFTWPWQWYLREFEDVYWADFSNFNSPKENGSTFEKNAEIKALFGFNTVSYTHLTLPPKA